MRPLEIILIFVAGLITGFFLKGTIMNILNRLAAVEKFIAGIGTAAVADATTVSTDAFDTLKSAFDSALNRITTLETALGLTNDTAAATIQAPAGPVESELIPIAGPATIAVDPANTINGAAAADPTPAPVPAVDPAPAPAPATAATETTGI